MHDDIEIPCVKCITFSVCKQTEENLVDRCSLMRQYLNISYPGVRTSKLLTKELHRRADLINEYFDKTKIYTSREIPDSSLFNNTISPKLLMEILKRLGNCYKKVIYGKD